MAFDGQSAEVPNGTAEQQAAWTDFASPELAALRDEAASIGRLTWQGTPDRSRAVESLIRQAVAKGLERSHGAKAVRAALAAGFEAADKERGMDASGDGAWREHAITAPSLAAKTLDPAPFILPGFIPAGLTILAGRPRAGKSSLALDVAVAIAGGCGALGTLQPAHGAVLYLALEESERRLKQRVERLLAAVRAPSAERLTLVSRWRRLEEGGLGDLGDWCGTVADPRLIVIDILAKVQRPAKARPHEIDSAIIAGLRGLATMHGLAVLALHHTPKRNADDVLDGIGLGHAADTTLVWRVAAAARCCMRAATKSKRPKRPCSSTSRRAGGRC